MTTYADHPVIVAASTAAATLALCGALTFTWIVPTMVESANSKLEIRSRELEEAAAEKRTADKRISALEGELSNLKLNLTKSEQEKSNIKQSSDREIADLKRENFSLLKSNSFVTGSPYPVGFEKVHIGDPVSKITEEYNYPNKSEFSGSFYFNPPSDLFQSVGFIFDREETGVVESISFSIGRLRGLGKDPKPELPKNWIEDSLGRALGEPPIRIGPDKRCLVWPLHDDQKTLVFYFQGDTDFTITQKLAPGGCYFTKEQEKEMNDVLSTAP